MNHPSAPIEDWAWEDAIKRQGVFRPQRPIRLFAGLLTACGEGAPPPQVFVQTKRPYGWAWLPIKYGVREEFLDLLQARGRPLSYVVLADMVVREYITLNRYRRMVCRKKSMRHRLDGAPVRPIEDSERAGAELLCAPAGAWERSPAHSRVRFGRLRGCASGVGLPNPRALIPPRQLFHVALALASTGYQPALRVPHPECLVYLVSRRAVQSLGP